VTYTIHVFKGPQHVEIATTQQSTEYTITSPTVLSGLIFGVSAVHELYGKSHVVCNRPDSDQPSYVMNPMMMGGMMGQNASNPMLAQMQAQMVQMQQTMAANNPRMCMGGVDSQANGGGTRCAGSDNEGRAPAARSPRAGARDGSNSDSASAEAGWAAAQPRRALTRSAAQTSTATPTTSKLPAAFLLNLGISQQHVLPPAALKTVPPPPVQVAGGEYLYPAEPPNHVAAATEGTKKEKAGSVAADPLALDFAAALREDEPMTEAGKAGGEEDETPAPLDSPRRAVDTATAKAAADAANRAAGSGAASHTPAIAADKQGGRPAPAAPLAAISVGAGKAGVGPMGGAAGSQSFPPDVERRPEEKAEGATARAPSGEAKRQKAAAGSGLAGSSQLQIEARAASGGGDQNPPPLPWPTFDDLPAELLALVAHALLLDDELAASLSCRKLRAAVAKRDGRAKLTTRILTALTSLYKLKWAVSCRLPMGADLCATLAYNGLLDMLQFAIGMQPLRSSRHSRQWDESTCAEAAKGGHLEVLQWARANGCPWDWRTCMYAAQNGHLEVLQWARANGCPWDETTCLYAAGNGHLEVLQWVHANGCPLGSLTIAGARWRWENGPKKVPVANFEAVVEWLRATAA